MATGRGGRPQAAASLDPDPVLLDEAERHVTAARDFFVNGSDYQTERCDALLAQIAEARANSRD